MIPSILLIDDSEPQLSSLEAGLRSKIPPDEARILTWAPGREDEDPRAVFKRLIDDNDTTLVVTDYDLTGKARTGLFGSTIVGWCQSEAIPVGDYSRGRRNGLPTEPNLFELRVPIKAGEDSDYIAALFRGFREIHGWFEDHPKLLDERSPAAILAEGLGRPSLESDFALYARLAPAGALVDKVKETAAESKRPDRTRKQDLLTYIIGHLLVNAVLKFPGPILTKRALVAFCGVGEREAINISELFTEASYRGPFKELNNFYWLSRVDELLEIYGGDREVEAETLGEVNRIAVEAKLGRQVERHACKRCAGKNGGFWCPFTERTVCQLPDCSVAVTSWIPQGAQLCRVERGFYDEWAPVLGL